MVRETDLSASSGGKPGFDLGEIPEDAARSSGKPVRELATLRHPVDRRVAKGHDLFRLMPSDRPQQIVCPSLRHFYIHLHVRECRRSSVKDDVVWHS